MGYVSCDKRRLDKKSGRWDRSDSDTADISDVVASPRLPKEIIMLRGIKKSLTLFILYIASTLTGYAETNKPDGLQKTYSAYNYQQTREHLISAINQHNLVLFGEFDHAKAARSVQLSMPPTTVLVFGNPVAGTPLMLAHPDMALDLPFRVLISQQHDGRVLVSYHPVKNLQVYGLDMASIQALEKLEKLVLNAIQ